VWYIWRMATFPRVSPRRLTGSEESELVAAADRLKAAERRAGELMRERDRLIADVVQAGARVKDVADVLNLTRNAVYAAVERALGE
jgi:DNA-binding NarL/FixJ family response regulator